MILKSKSKSNNHNIRGVYKHSVILGIMLISVMVMTYNTEILHQSVFVLSAFTFQQDDVDLCTCRDFNSTIGSYDDKEEDDDIDNDNYNDNFNNNDNDMNINENKNKRIHNLVTKQLMTNTRKYKPKETTMKQTTQTTQKQAFMHTGDYFDPGSLVHQSRAKTLSQCYVGTKQKPYIIRNTKKVQFCTHSPEYKFTIRHGLRTIALELHYMARKFNISQTSNFEFLLQPCQKFDNIKDNSLKVTVLDHPIQRFIAGIRLMFNQRGVFTNRGNNNKIPKKYNRFLKIIEQMDDKEKENVSLGTTSKDLMQKIQMYDTFIQDYYNYYGTEKEMLHENMVLSMMPSLFDSNQLVYDIEQFDVALEANILSIDFEKLGTLVNATHLTKDVSINYAFVPPPLTYLMNSESLTMESLSNTSIQKLCRMFITDLCCMNYKLPEACQSSKLPDNELVQCEWVIPTTANNNSKHLNTNNERRIIGRIGSSASISSISSSSVTISNKHYNVKNRDKMDTKMQKRSIRDSRNTIKKIPFTKTGELFEPGSLTNRSRARTISQCYVGSKEFPFIKPNYYSGCAYSQKYNLLLWLIEKTGSNTQKNVMKNIFDAEPNHIDRKLCFVIGNYNKTVPSSTTTITTAKRKKIKVAVTRHPVDQFISGVKEVFYLTGVYTAMEAKFGYDIIPPKYRNFMHLIDGMSLEQKRNVSMGITKQDLNITTTMFEQFVNDYDGKDVFNTHIAAAIPKLFRIDLEHDVEQFDLVMDSSTLIPEFTKLARQLNTTRLPKEQKARTASSFGTRALGTISNTTIQKICRLVATDLCCLNYELPDVCRHIDIPDNERVMCEWIKTPTGEKRIIGRFGSSSS